MSQPILKPPPGFEALSIDQQVDYVQALWQQIASRPAAVPVPDWHLHILEARLQSAQRPDKIEKSWDEVREEILQLFDK